MANTTGVNVGSGQFGDLSTDATLAANSDSKVPSQKAVKAYVDAHATAAVDTDGALAADSDVKVASQKATKTYVDGKAVDYTKAPVAAPSAANDPGVVGSWAYDATHIYVCVATDTWVRADLATW